MSSATKQETTTPTKTMRAVQGKDYGDIDEMLSLEDGVPIPSLQDVPEKKRKDWLLIKTLAVSLAPGDCRVLSGKTSPIQGPPSFPYVPGGDACGIVQEVPPDEDYFQVGDRVAARFADYPLGALGEYALVRQDVCDKVPDGISSNDAAALVSASPAMLLAGRIKQGERVLVFGAGGGVGSYLCQLLRTTQKASYIAGVGKDTERLLREPISCDKAVDYTKEDPWNVKEWKENPFDVVIDLASGNWLRTLEEAEKNDEPMIVKSASNGGRFLTLTLDEALFEAHSMWEAAKLFTYPLLWRAIKSRTYRRRSLPKFTFAMSLDGEREVATKTLQLASDGKMKACTEVYPFTTEGVLEAFHKQDSRHPHGKVVVQIAEE